MRMTLPLLYRYDHMDSINLGTECQSPINPVWNTNIKWVDLGFKLTSKKKEADIKQVTNKLTIYVEWFECWKVLLIDNEYWYSYEEYMKQMNLSATWVIFSDD